MKRIFYSMVSCVLALSVMYGCATTSETVMKGEAYQINDAYNSVIVVKVDRQGNKVTDIAIDEAMDIMSWADITKLKEPEAIKQEDKGVIKEKTYAKKVQIGEGIFNLVGDKYILQGGEEFSLWLKNGENAKYYVTHLQQGDYYLLNKEGVKYDTSFVESKEVLPFKAKTNLYWQEGNGTLGYKKNMELISSYAKRYGIEGMTKADTGATLSSFDIYVNVIKKAYENAK